MAEVMKKEITPKIEFIETKKVDFSTYTLLEGFPGMGLVGTIAAKYLVDRLGFEEIGFIDANIFIPIVRIHKGVPICPSRIYASKKHKLALLISEQIIPRFYTEKMAKAVVEWIKAKKIKKIISLAGINTGATGKGIVYGIAANEKSKKEVKKHGIELIEEGITTGITALILLELKKSNLIAYSVLGDVSTQADYKAAAAVIEKVNKILGLSVKIDPLLKEAQETEAQLLKHLRDLKKTDTNVQKFEEQTPMTT